MKTNDPRLDRMRRCLDGEAESEDWRAFEQDLREDETFRLDYLRYLNLGLALEEGAAMPKPVNDGDADSKDRRREPMANRWLALAATIALLLTGLAWMWQRQGEEPTLGTLLFAEGCEWHGTAPSEGARLTPGRLSLKGGLAIIRLDGGAEIALRSDSVIELINPMEARLRLGRVTVRAEGEAAGFKLLTPEKELIDLGTEFAVAVDAGGATDLHVIDGEVAYTAGSIASEGDALRFEKGAENPVPLLSRESGFNELVREAQPRERRDLMSVYEGFHYPEGIYQPSEINRGKGWAGPWRLRTESERRGLRELDVNDEMRIVHGRLSVPWPLPGGKQGGLEMPAGRSYRLRELRDPVQMDGEGILYFSLMTQEPDHKPGRSRVRPVEGMRLTFRSSEDYHGEALSFGWNEGLRPQIKTGTSGVFASPAIVPEGQTLLWVGKIIHHPKGEDEISFSIYGESDPLEYTEPTTWHVVSRGVTHDAVFDLVLLSSTGSNARIADELRIGPTWRSVVPFRFPN